jgi:anti-sigma B factor antagonist
MPQEPLTLEDLPGQDGQRILRLIGPLTISNLFEFQSKVRADKSPMLIIDLTSVPYMDSAGIGCLVGAYVTHNKDGHTLSLVGVNSRVRDALKITHVEQFFRFYDSMEAVEQSLAH